MREYGPIGFMTYSMISAVSYTSWCSAIYMGVDVEPITSKLQEWKSLIWTESHRQATKKLNDAEIAPGGIRQWISPEFGTVLLVALACHKVIFPIRLGLAAFLTPGVARFFRRNGLEFWMKSAK